MAKPTVLSTGWRFIQWITLSNLWITGAWSLLISKSNEGNLLSTSLLTLFAQGCGFTRINRCQRQRSQKYVVTKPIERFAKSWDVKGTQREKLDSYGIPALQQHKTGKFYPLGCFILCFNMYMISIRYMSVLVSASQAISCHLPEDYV